MLPIKHQTRHYNTAIWSLAFSRALGCCSLLVLTVSSDRLFVTFLPCSDWQLWLLSFVWSTLCKTLGRKSECAKIKWWGQRLWDNRACRLSNAHPPYASYVVNLAWQSKEWLRRRKREGDWLFLERKRNCGAVSAGVITRSFDFITCIGIRAFERKPFIQASGGIVGYVWFIYRKMALQWKK